MIPVKFRRAVAFAALLSIAGLTFPIIPMVAQLTRTHRALATALAIVSIAGSCVVLYLSVTARCPSCGNLVPHISSYPIFWFGGRSRRCPRCGADLR
jgi:hypothetical protein